MKNPATRTRRSETVRCAIYTRKSSEEGLDQEFNSPQAQREACEAFILNPAVDLETATGFAAVCNQGERLKPVRGAAADRVGGPLGSV